MRTEKKCALGAGNTQGRGDNRHGGAVVYPQCSIIGTARQPIPLAILLANAERLLDSLDPEALGWAADLLDLAAQALHPAPLEAIP